MHQQSFILPLNIKGAKREFHVVRAARERYDIEQALFSLHGQLLLTDFSAAQQLTYKINQQRDTKRLPQDALRAGELFAAGLLDELLHLLVEAYRERINDKIMSEALEYLRSTVGDKALSETLQSFAYSFPPTSVYSGEETLDSYLARVTEGVAHQELVLEELLMLFLANANPALAPFAELLTDAPLKGSAYTQVISGLQSFFASQPPLVEGRGSLFETLRAPALESPSSLEGQLAFLRDTFAPLLGDKFEAFFKRLLTALDIFKEEGKLFNKSDSGAPPTHVLDFVTMANESLSRPLRKREEYERFSPDKAWMPRVVMLAKSSYVWLDQLSKSHNQDISKLDQIPDSELDELARRGFTGLWLIGLWERSEASKRIKHLRGQPDAVASAYALYDYQIAQDLGGDAAYENLRERAWQRGIRLASDMVPNHVGIDSRWVVEHPDWFLQLDHPPYPGYTFKGTDLSSDERVGIFIEDHYFDNSDAAVVFKRLDRWTNSASYIYHGNDGTTMPWNDTAQIDYLNPAAREAIIQTILHVARKFPIIRFDAAMTLAKQHIQRLWYPEPGHGGAIPSRAQYGSMRHEDFERAIPHEFWREVVDRVAAEVPDTLLLAEAFWMMEGYFVRTLGMHRVYNSAFMNMLMREENAKYRQSIKNTLEFDPDILKRFVNFMNNPDEESAIEQFGSDDKYFGVALIMSTMPGLPMYGHGQIEGYHEKYGMEYRRAKWDESPNEALIHRHYKEIFPLLHRRDEFAEVDNFLLYDFFSSEGVINEDVYAYSNNYKGKASLILYNNKFQSAKGWIKHSTAFKDKADQQLKHRTLHDGLGVHGSEKHFVILKEHISGLEYLRRSRQLQEQGFYTELEAFKYQVFIDIRQVFDADGLFEQVYEQLQGKGVDSVEEACKDLAFTETYAQLTSLLRHSLKDEKALLEDLETLAVSQKLELKQEGFLAYLKALSKLSSTKESTEQTDLAAYSSLVKNLLPLLRIWSSLQTLSNTKTSSEKLLENLRLKRYWQKNYGHEQSDLLELITLSKPSKTALEQLKALLKTTEAKTFLLLNEHEGVTYFNQERYRLLSAVLTATNWLEQQRQKKRTKLETGLNALIKLELSSSYDFNKLIEKPKKVTKKAQPASKTKAPLKAQKASKSTSKPKRKGTI